KARCGTNPDEKCALAVRSSAEEEDSELSFAGQFETVLNVPPESASVKEAYKRVIASLFSDKAEAYYRRSGNDIRNMKMAVGCILMVDAAVSGVMYSANPGGDGGEVVINSTWGLGKSIVEGQTDADLYVVGKDAQPAIKEKRLGAKVSMVISRGDEGTTSAATPPEIAGKSSLTDAQALELAGIAMRIERHFRKPQDIEWAIRGDGRIVILQARPLRVQEKALTAETLGRSGKGRSSKVLMKAGGLAVQQGAGAGRVFILRRMDELDKFPRGAVLVARNDSSDFIRVMPYASAIITDTGTLTSHMASICRELRVPTFVNTGNATQTLTHGREITVDIGDGNEMTVYEGIDREIVARAGAGSMRMEDIYEFRRKRYVLRYITPLNLVDPLLDSFTPEGCKTMHDVLRFIHEKSVMELVESARHGMPGMKGMKGREAAKLELPIPTGIMAVDIGGGLNTEEGHAPEKGKATFEQVASIPLRAILKGMMHPGAWHSDAVSLKAGDFLTSMMRMPDIVSDNESYVGYNVAIISREYVNLSLRFGYHFSMLDCFCSEKARNNHIYFRFAGGATDLVKRSRRVRLIELVLKEYGFNLQIKGDLVIARLANLGLQEMEKVLDQVGRLLAYTRQLDAVLHDDAKVERYAKNFLEGEYGL
ncbi:MAG TPA: PEP/pyruvate-binding domain-containing protein, partial [Dissulfurispiraceae bacterium]